MIELYISLASKLREIPGLKLVDIEGTNEAKIFPAAFIDLGEIPYEQTGQGSAIASFPFTIRIELDPKHRSGSNSPVLDALASGFGVVNAIKTTLNNDEIDFIGGIMLTKEGLKKAKGKYEATLNFIGTVEYTPG